jgi:hypothetical protein
MPRPRDYTVDGMKIDGVLGVPVEFISCPGCGKKYTVCKTVCKDCDECQRCHDGRCTKPDFVKVDDAFLQEMAEKGC